MKIEKLGTGFCRYCTSKHIPTISSGDDNITICRKCKAARNQMDAYCRKVRAAVKRFRKAIAKGHA